MQAAGSTLLRHSRSGILPLSLPMQAAGSTLLRHCKAASCRFHFQRKRLEARFYDTAKRLTLLLSRIVTLDPRGAPLCIVVGFNMGTCLLHEVQKEMRIVNRKERVCQ